MPSSRMGGTAGDIPVVVLHEGMEVYFSSSQPELAIRYLNKLADEARRLAQAVAQRVHEAEVADRPVEARGPYDVGYLPGREANAVAIREAARS
ncbi:hypothetical protein [Kribbella deserti]|uniref:Uncharacterized protein n=1 Tax=Kribbella deserti TaxID=1926257 RepID=A0ABV6QN99_9ACTN